MGRSSGRIQDVSFLQRTTWNRWRSNCVRVEDFQGFTSLQILQEIQQDLKRKSIEPEKFTDRIILMSMYIDWTKKGNDEICISNAEKVKDYAMRFLQGHGTFLGPGDEKKWYGKCKYKPEGKWDSVASHVSFTHVHTTSLLVIKIHCLQKCTTETRLEKTVCLWVRNPQLAIDQHLGCSSPCLCFRRLG